jgi:hypothetical protein
MIEATPEELALIGKIADRATIYYRRYTALSERAARSAIADEILTVHEEIMPLRLRDLLDAPLADFLNDIRGIHMHLSRSNPPYLKDQFVPRYAEKRRQRR